MILRRRFCWRCNSNWTTWSSLWCLCYIIYF